MVERMPELEHNYIGITRWASTIYNLVHQISLPYWWSCPHMSVHPGDSNFMSIEYAPIVRDMFMFRTVGLHHRFSVLGSGENIGLNSSRNWLELVFVFSLNV